MPRTAPKMPKRLAAAALELFGQRGIDDVTVEQIAAHAGVTKGSFYSHYRSKHEIILAACTHYYQTHLRRLHAKTARLARPRDRLRRALELSIRICVADERNRVFTSELIAMSLHDEPMRQGWAQFYNAVREMLIGLVSAVQAEGGTNGSDARTSVDLMLAAIEGVKMRAGFEPHVADPAEQRAIVDGMMDYLCPSGRVAPTGEPVSSGVQPGSPTRSTRTARVGG